MLKKFTGRFILHTLYLYTIAFLYAMVYNIDNQSKGEDTMKKFLNHIAHSYGLECPLTIMIFKAAENGATLQELKLLEFMWQD